MKCNQMGSFSSQKNKETTVRRCAFVLITASPRGELAMCPNAKSDDVVLLSCQTHWPRRLCPCGLARPLESTAHAVTLAIDGPPLYLGCRWGLSLCTLVPPSQIPITCALECVRGQGDTINPRRSSTSRMPLPSGRAPIVGQLTGRLIGAGRIQLY